MDTLSKMSDFIFKVLFLLTTLRPFPHLPLLNIAWRLLWLGWLMGITYLSLYWHVSSKDTSVGGLIGIALFVSNAFTNMLSICEAVFRLREYQRGRRLCAEVDNIFAHLLDLHKSATALRQCSRRPFAVFLAVSGCEALKMCLHLLHSYSPLYWYSLPTVIGLRMRYLQAFGIALQLNMRIDQLQFALEKLITHNVAKQPKYRSDIWRPYELWEYEQLNALRLIYGRLYESFVCLNGYFGWTGLTICNAAIFEFTCYAYWTFRALYKRQHYHRILYNGTTSLSLMVCVAALFLSAELSAQKLRQLSSEITSSWYFQLVHFSFKVTSSLYCDKMSVGKRFTKKTFIIYYFGFISGFVNLGSILFACRSFTKSQLIYKLYAGYWILHMTIFLFYTLLYEPQQLSDLSMGGLMYSVLYITQLLAHLTILIESFFMDSKRQQMMKTYKEFEKRFNKELGSTTDYRNLKAQSCISATLSVAAIIGTALITIISWDEYQFTLLKTILHYHSLLSSVTLQFRILEMILGITVLNEYAAILCHKLDEMGERNIRRVFGHYLRGLPVSKGYIIRVMPQALHPSEEDDEQQLRVYKKFYGEIYNMFKYVNEIHGWSVLAFMIMYFVYFIINSYWVIFELITRLGDHVTLLRNLGFLIVVVTQLWILCWQSQNSEEQSRQIGCIMFKLVKPMGNKSYNDLVTDFSLQTLHQQYIITAKQFFNLNLNLLGSMVASIVTYLVILIQFMFAEKNKSDRNLILNSVVDYGNSTRSASN